MKKGVYQSQIIALKDVSPDVFFMRLYLPQIAATAQAGNFLELHVTDCVEAFWRRPISIHDADAKQGTVDLLVKAIGKGTRVLRQMTVGQAISVLGPLGNAFSLLPTTQTALMLAGGIGIAPFSLLSRTLRAQQITTQLFYGMNDQSQCCGIDIIQQYFPITYTTVDGSLGERGFVTEQVEKFIQKNNPADLQIFACGPTPMLATVQKLAATYQIPTQLSVETMMACGFGACVGCAVPLQHPQPGVKEFALACKDGPVFNSSEIILND